MEQQVSALEITFGSFHLEIQQSILVWLVLCVIFAVFFIWAGKKIDKADPSKASTGVVYVCEEILNLVLYVIKGNLREKTKRYLPFFGTLILMMLVSNLIGLVGLQNPTSNVSFNATLAVTIFFMIQINGIKRAGLKARIKSLSEPMAILLPMNIVGEIALPLSMTMRLFGNILAGCIITMLIYTYEIRDAVGRTRVYIHPFPSRFSGYIYRCDSNVYLLYAGILLSGAAGQ